jgi:hypothetical protein
VGTLALVDSPLLFTNCTFENNIASGMAPLLFVDSLNAAKRNWPSCTHENGNIFNSEDDIIMMTFPYHMRMTSTTSDVEQTSDTIITPAIRIELIDYFGNLLQIPASFAEGYIGAAIITSWHVGNDNNDDLMTTMTNQTSVPLGITIAHFHDFQFEWSELRMPSVPGHIYHYTARLEALLYLPFGREISSVVGIDTRSVRTEVTLKMRDCRKGEYVTKTSCEPCSPVVLLSPPSQVTELNHVVHCSFGRVATQM